MTNSLSDTAEHPVLPAEAAEPVSMLSLDGVPTDLGVWTPVVAAALSLLAELLRRRREKRGA